MLQDKIFEKLNEQSQVSWIEMLKIDNHHSLEIMLCLADLEVNQEITSKESHGVVYYQLSKGNNTMTQNQTSLFDEDEQQESATNEMITSARDLTDEQRSIIIQSSDAPREIERKYNISASVVSGVRANEKNKSISRVSSVSTLSDKPEFSVTLEIQNNKQLLQLLDAIPKGIDFKVSKF